MVNLEKKIKSHQKVLTNYVEQLAQERNESLGSTGGYQAVTDVKHNQFQLIHISWHERKFYFKVLLHFSIHPETGNIWVQQNNTEIPLDTDFNAMGIPKSNLVLGFRPADMRELSDFAVM
jgi:XisI protein